MTAASTKAEDAGLGCLSTLLLVPYSIWRAFVFSTLWAWFAVPFGLIRISTGWMMGLFAMFSIVRIQFLKSEDFRAEEDSGAISLKSLGICAIYYAIMMVIGWFGVRMGL